jgi:hypothetical protein
MFALSSGQTHDAPEGRKLLRHLGKAPRPSHLPMAGHTKATRHGNSLSILALSLWYHPSAPASRRGNTIAPCTSAGMRSSDCSGLDVMFVAFIHFALIFDAMRSVNTLLPKYVST